MIAAIADTHAAIWFVYADARLSSAAQMKSVWVAL